MLLRKFAAYLRTSSERSEYHVVNMTNPGSEESMLTPAEPRMEVSSAQIVEGDGSMRKIQVGEPSGTLFTHFLDGVERMHLPCYRSIVPMLYAFTAAVVRERKQDKKMATWDWKSEEALYIPAGYFELGDLATKIKIELVKDSGSQDDKPIEPNPAIMTQRCREQAQKTRERLEKFLLRKWTAEYGGSEANWLLLDGTLSRDEETQRNVVGLIKSHQTQYFDADDQIKILTLAPGERSSIFKVRRGGGSPPLTWYLRLRPNDGRDVFFGLVRLEIADAPGALEMVDNVSKWILAERQPLSLPDSRWDRLLYPIRDCEQFLRSIAPSRVVMQAAMAGV